MGIRIRPQETWGKAHPTDTETVFLAERKAFVCGSLREVVGQETQWHTLGSGEVHLRVSHGCGSIERMTQDPQLTGQSKKLEVIAVIAFAQEDPPRSRRSLCSLPLTVDLNSKIFALCE